MVCHRGDAAIRRGRTRNRVNPRQLSTGVVTLIRARNVRPLIPLALILQLAQSLRHYGRRRIRRAGGVLLRLRLSFRLGIRLRLGCGRLSMNRNRHHRRHRSRRRSTRGSARGCARARRRGREQRLSGGRARGGRSAARRRHHGTRNSRISACRAGSDNKS